MLALEKTSAKRECPGCGRRTFKRYTNTDSGEPIAEEAGRCDREVNCGYHLPPKEYFAERGMISWEPRPKPQPKPQPKPRKLGEIPIEYLERSVANVERNAFARFLLDKYDRADVMRVCEDYGVGDFEGFTTFWRRDTAGSLWTAKLIKYDAATGKRRKDIDYSFDWMHALLKRRGVLPKSCDYRRVLFGAHLLTNDGALVAILEAEKSAIIAALELPEYRWLACGGRTQINAEKLRAFGKQRVMLFPDGDSFDYWSKIASEARAQGANVIVSDLLETELTAEQKAVGWDLADYLLMPEPMPEPVEASAPVEAAAVVITPLAMPAIASVATTPSHDWATLFSGHCRRCGTPLTGGPCALCATPLPF